MAGCVPRSGRNRGLLWIDCESETPTVAFAAQHNHRANETKLEIYLGKGHAVREIRPQFIAALRRWALSSGGENFAGLAVHGASGEMRTIDPSLLGLSAHGFSRRKTPSATRPRILVFSHDGRGLGHLRRLSRLGKALQGHASVLYVTGHREAAWLVPPECEYVHLPNRDSLDARRSRQWGRQPFLTGDLRIGARLRRDILRSTVDAYQPDALIMDYLPLGIDEEMKEFVFELPGCRKYFVSRGILADPERIYEDVLTPSSLEALRSCYDLILVMSDHKIIDSVKEYSLDSRVANKIVYTGYAAEQIEAVLLDKAREERGLSPGDKWVVCSAGGGKEGELLIERCWELAHIFPECHFDIVVGPRSRLSLDSDVWADGRRIRLVHVESKNLPVSHAAADIVITRGGYNSLMEACVGGGSILVAPIATDYEQVNHARRLSAFRDITIVDRLADLDLGLKQVLQASAKRPDRMEDIDLDGLGTAASVILADLSIHRITAWSVHGSDTNLTHA